MKSFFSDSQWEWIAERTHEGYAQADLARFLGVHRETVRRGLIRIGRKPVKRDELPALSQRHDEFLHLRDKNIF